MIGYTRYTLMTESRKLRVRGLLKLRIILSDTGRQQKQSPMS
jgi:hypothetical protein